MRTPRQIAAKLTNAHDRFARGEITDYTLRCLESLLWAEAHRNGMFHEVVAVLNCTN